MVEAVTYFLIGAAISEHYADETDSNGLFLTWVVAVWPYYLAVKLLKKYPMVESKLKSTMLTEDK